MRMLPSRTPRCSRPIDAARRLHLGQGARQADRDQPQRHHPPGGARAVAARRRTADQPKPASVPATEEAMSKLALLAFLAAAPASAQTPAVDAARAAGIVGERYDGYIGVAAPASAAV